MCAGCLSTQGNGAMNGGSQSDPSQYTDNNQAYSRSGSVAEDTKFDGSSSTDMKFDGQSSNSGNNTKIGNQGWGS